MSWFLMAHCAVTFFTGIVSWQWVPEKVMNDFIISCDCSLDHPKLPSGKGEGRLVHPHIIDQCVVVRDVADSRLHWQSSKRLHHRRGCIPCNCLPHFIPFSIPLVSSKQAHILLRWHTCCLGLHPRRTCADSCARLLRRSIGKR
jgi:hypothetical protein